MTIRKIELKGDGANGEQLTFTAIELGEVVRRIAQVEFEKKEANEEWSAELKVLKKRMYALAAAIPGKEKERAIT